MSTLNTELIQHIKLIADEKKIPRDTVADSLKDAIMKAYIKEFPDTEIEVIIDIDQQMLIVNRLLKVVEPYSDLNDYTEISLSDAKKHDKNVALGETLRLNEDLAKLERPMVSHILQVFKHNISNQSNKEIFKEWQPRIGEVIFAEVEKVDSRSGFVTVNLGDTFGFLSHQEKIPGEMLIPGQKYNFYIKDVKEQTKGWPVILSRADAGLVKYLLKIQIPEIQENIIEIKDIARIAGFKTKLSVVSHQGGVEPIGTIVGPRGSRINLIQDQIHREHIEVIEYTDDFTRYIVNVCSPAEIAGVAIIEPTTPDKRRQIILVAKGDKLALLIGKKGTNVRLISEMLKADVEIRTIEDAHAGNLEYQRIDMQSLRQQTFASSYNKYRVRGDVLSGFEKGRSSGYSRHSDRSFTNNHNVSTKNKKDKSSILSDFQGMNKEDLLNELSNVNSSDDIASDIVDNYDEYNNK